MNKTSGLKKITGMKLFLPLVCLLAVLIAGGIVIPDFFSVSVKNGVLSGYLIDIINRASELVILAIGMTLVTAASGGQDISVKPPSMAVAALVVRFSKEKVSVESLQNPFILAVLAALAGSALCGVFNGFLVAKLKVQPMVATLILYTAGRGIAQLVTNGQITYIRVESYKVLGGYISHCPIPTPIFAAIIMVILAYIILKKTALGLYVESVGINGEASRLVGLNSTMIKFLTYVICGVLAGIAGLVASSRIYSADANNIGLNLEMDAILVTKRKHVKRRQIMPMIRNRYYTIQALTTVLYGMNVSADRLPVYKAVVVIVIVLMQSPVFKRMVNNMKLKRQSQEAAEGGSH